MAGKSTVVTRSFGNFSHIKIAYAPGPPAKSSTRAPSRRGRSKSGTTPRPIPIARPNIAAANAFVRVASAPRWISGFSTGRPVRANSANFPHAPYTSRL